MINISQTIKNSCKADKNTHTEYIRINNQTIYIKGKLNATAYKDTTFFGTFNMKVLEFETENTTQFRNRQFEYYKVIDGNAFKVGTFITTEVVNNDSKDTIKVTANDYALKFAVPYTSELDYSSGNITLYDVLKECCTQVGVELENKFIDNNSFKVDSNQFVNGELVGDVICAIAGISGNFATITNEDKLRLTFTNGTGAEQTTTIDGSAQINASGFKDIDLLGNTTQETTTGKNLLPNDLATKTINGITITKNNDGTYKVNGTATGDVSEAVCNNFISMSGTWRMLGCPSGGSSSTYMLSAYVGYWGAGSPNIDIGSGTNITYTGNVKVRFYIKSGTTCNNLIFKPMLTTDTSATINNWEPYTYGASPNPNYPQPIETTTGRNVIEVVGKNLLPNIATTTTINGITFTANVDGTILVSGTASATAYLTYPTFSLNAGTYTLSAGVYVNTLTRIQLVEDTSGRPLLASTQNASSQTFTTTSTKNVFLQFRINSGEVINTTFKPQLEKGSSSSTYEPYKGNSYEVNLGKNLFNYNDITTSANFTNNYNGTFTRTTNGTNMTINTNATSVPYDTFLLSAGTYSVSFDITTTANTTLTSFYLCTTQNGTNTNIQKSIQISITANSKTHIKAENCVINNNAEKVGLVAYFSASTGIVVSNIQLEKGDVASSYSPYFEPIELCKIGTYQDRLFKASGKNLFNENTITGIYNNRGTYSNGVITTIQETANTSNFNVNFNSITLPTNTYYISMDIRIKSGTGTFSKINDNNVNWTLVNAPTLSTNYQKYVYKYTYTSSKTFNIMLIQFQNSNNAIYEIKNIMLSTSSNTDYEPYGNYWYLYKTIGKVVLNGSENWSYQNQYPRFVSSYTGDLITTGFNVFCNYYRGGLDTVSNNNCISFWTNGSSRQVLIHDERYTTKEALNEWLSSNNVTCYGILYTPTYTKIENDELIGQLDSIKTLDLFDGINNITTNAPFFLTYLDDNIEVLEDYTDLDDKRDTQPITSVSIGTSQVEGQEAILRDENLIAQYGEHWLVINDNPFGYTLEKRQQLVKAIFDKVKGFGYSSFKSEYSYRPYLELGDKIKFRNKDGDLIDSVILRYNFDFDNCTFEAPSITSATIDYELSPDADEKAKRAEIIANQAESSITSITQGLQIDEDGNSQVIESIRTTQKQNSLDIEAITSYEMIDGKETLTGVKTRTGFTFNSKGLIIESSKNTYKAVHDETGEYYYDGDTPLGETTNEGSKYKNMELYGEFRYGKDSIGDNAMFVDMLYTDEDGEECFGTFYNGS